MLGTLGLTVEIWSPGAVLPGVVGGICLLLAFFAFQVLPVSATGVLLILFGVVLLLLEVKVTSYGVLAVGGLVGLLLGSMMLVDSPLPELQVGLRLVVPISLAVGAIIFFLVRLAVRAQRGGSVTGRRRHAGGDRQRAVGRRARLRRSGPDTRGDLECDLARADTCRGHGRAWLPSRDCC